jgi:hypothetical protein
MKRIHRRLTFANVISCLALFVALGGASYAATQLPKNSVGSKQLKANAITTAKIKNGAVTGTKIKTSSLGTVPAATDASQLGGVPASGFQKSAMWALVEANGTILAQSGGISLQASTGTGAYWLHFPAQVAGRGISVTPWEGWEPADPGTEASACGGVSVPGSVVCSQGTNTVDDAFVGTQESGVYKKMAFYVIVLP